MQGICTGDGTLVKLCFRPGKEHDSQAFAVITEGLEGIFVTDAGYLLKEADLKRMFESGRKPCTATRKNMNRPMTKEQFLFHLVEDAKQWFLPSLQAIAKLEF